MTLISNQENTIFQLKGINDKEWTAAGKGKIVYIRLNADQAYEIAAKPDGYCRKEVALPEPLRELRFTFEIGDREDKEAGAILELDVRVLSVSTSEILASAHERINEVCSTCGELSSRAEKPDCPGTPGCQSCSSAV